MNSKQQLVLRPISTERDGSGGGFDRKAASVRERPGLANASFRVYYSLRAGAVPFLWESAPGTPKSGGGTAVSPALPAKAVAPESSVALLPPISPPPSYQPSFQLKGKRGCRSRSSWPAGGIVRALLGMLGLGGRKGHHPSRRRPASYL